jgi:hypothetical protein
MNSFMSRLKKYVVVGMLAMVMACMGTAMAWADDRGSTEDDTTGKIITIEWTDSSDTVHTVDVTETMVADKIKTTRQGALYCKNDIWHVVGTDRWVSLTDVLKAAGAYSSVTTETYLVMWVLNDGSTVPQQYTKYYPRYAEMSEKGYPLSFYGNTTRTEFSYLAPSSVETCIALNCASAEVGEDEYASETLADLSMSTTRAPRLLWGLPNDISTADLGGNRFPSNITKIVLHEGQPSVD